MLTSYELGYRQPFNRNIAVEDMHHELHKAHHTVEDLEYCLQAGMAKDEICFYGWPTATQKWGESLAFSYVRNNAIDKLHVLARYEANLLVGQSGLKENKTPLEFAESLGEYLNREIIVLLKKL